jgi:fructose-bisphosphate aldolase, class I
MSDCRQVAARMVAPGKGILAADESISTMSARLAAAGVTPGGTARRDYRELLVTTPELARGVSGVILCDETLRQRLADGRPFPVALRELGLLPGIKVDTGAHPCPGLAGQTVTEGLAGLPGRLAGYAELGAAFAKWRAVYRIHGRGLPSAAAVHANAHALARYAAACQEAGLVPIVEPEVLMDGDHPLSRCAEVSARVQRAVREQLAAFSVDLAGIVLKPNMVLEGSGCTRRTDEETVAERTVQVLADWPAELAGVAFLSGGQSPCRATRNLAAMRAHATPWPLTFSFGRALVDPALAAWAGDPARVADGQAALAQRVTANAAAVTVPAAA